MSSASDKQANQYLELFMNGLKRRNPGQPEFHQAVEEVAKDLVPYLEDKQAYKDAHILDRMTEPDRIIIFRVCWVDDDGNTRVNRGMRVQFNNAIGPYKGGLRFHKSVTLSVLKFLGFEQGLQELTHYAANGWRKGRRELQPAGQERGRGNALLPVVHDGAITPHRPVDRHSRRVTSASERARSATSLANTSGCRMSSPAPLPEKGLGLRRQLDPYRGNRLRLRLLRAGDARYPRRTESRARPVSSRDRATWLSTPHRSLPSSAARS